MMIRRLIPAFLLVSMLAGCEPTVDGKQAEAQEKALADANRQVGLPKVANFTEKKLLATIYELRDQGSLPTYTYTQDMNGKLHLLCRSIGYGIPYATQFSNPEKWVDATVAERSHLLPQAEPNGLFMPSSAEGTWVIMATKEGPKPLYVEQKVIVSPVPLTNEPSTTTAGK